MKDRRGIERGKCNEGVCSCTEYEFGDGGNLCTYCGHVPVLHTELKMLKPSNITEYPRQENNSLEETILNGVEVNPNPQFDGSLTSEYSDMSSDKESSENLLNDIVNESTNSISTETSNFHQIQFSLPTFSPELADYLQGKATQRRIHYYRKLFVSELSVYLNQNNYLVSKNRAEQKWGYKALEKAILSAYPNVHQDEGVKSSYKRTGPLKWVISHLADRRRKKVTREEGKVFVCETTSVDEAYNLLQTLPSKLWQHTQLKKALFITKDLRFRLQAEETLPDYLLVDSILCYEIGLRLGSNINSLMTAAKTIIRKLHRIDISSIDALIDYLSEGDQRLVSASEIDPFPGPYATRKDGEMIIYLPKEKNMYIQNCSSLRVVIILLGVYYILDLTYPHDFGQVLGFFQTILLSESFELQNRSSKFNNIMESLARSKN